MARVRIAILLLVAAVVATEPLLHTHPLLPSPPNGESLSSLQTSCGACAVGSARVVVTPPHLVTPAASDAGFIVTNDSGFRTSEPLALGSRAPPLA